MFKINWSNINSFTGNHASKSLGYHRPCPICGSLKPKVVLELNDFQFYTDSSEEPKRYNVREVMCQNCHALFLDPCYSNHGFKVLFAEAGQSYGSAMEHTLEQIEWLGNHELLNAGARVLDVGCYEGFFLSRLPDNVKKLGVDIDQPAIERGRANYREKEIQFFLGDFETFQYSGPPPTVITMYHVLEHLPRPVEVLKKLRTISDESTKLIIEVPILENSRTNDINGFFSIQHITHFSRNSLQNCLALAGWKINETYETMDYNGYRILAVPSADHSLDMSAKYAQGDLIELYANLKNWYSSIMDVESIIQDIPRAERYVIWGGGAHTEFVYHVTSLFQTYRHAEFVIVDSDQSKQGKTWRGITIYDPSILKDIDVSSVTMIISSYGSTDTIYDAARNLGVPENNIVRLYTITNTY